MSNLPVHRSDCPQETSLCRVTLAASEIEAEMLAEQLRGHGIEPLVRIEDDLRASTRALGTLRWAYPIYVLERDLEDARAVLALVGYDQPATATSLPQRELLIGSLAAIGFALVLVLILLARNG